MALQLASGAPERRAAARKLELQCQRLARAQARLLARTCVSLRRFVDIDGPFQRGYSCRRDYAVERLGVSGSTATDWYRIGVVLDQCAPLHESWLCGELTYSALLALAKHVPLEDIPDWLPRASQWKLSELLREIALWQTRETTNEVHQPRGSVAPLHEETASERVRLNVPTNTHELYREALDVFSALDGGGAPPSVLLQWMLGEVGADLDASCDDPEEARRRLRLPARAADASNAPQAAGQEGSPSQRPRTVPLAQATASRPLNPRVGSTENEAAALDLRLRRLQRRSQPLQAALDLCLYRFSQHGFHQVLGAGNLEQWAMAVLDIEPRTLYRHQQRARGLLRSEDLRRAFVRGQVSVTAVQLLMRLARCGVPESALAPWIEEAKNTTAQNLDHKVRWAEQTYVQDYRPWARNGWPPPTDDQLAAATKPPHEALAAVSDEPPTTWEVPDKLWPLELQLEPETLDFLAMTLVSIQDSWARRLAPDQPTLSRPPIWACFRELLSAAMRTYKPLLKQRRNDLNTRVRDRDRFACMAPGCTRRAMLENHHIHFRSRGGPDIEENLVALCYPHHKMLHSGHIAIRGQSTKETSRTLRWRLGSRVDGYENEYFQGSSRIPGKSNNDEPRRDDRDS